MIKTRVFVSLKTSVFDPSSSVIKNTMQKLGYNSVMDIKENKYYELVFDENDPEIVKSLTKELGEKLLVNPNTENFRFEIIESS
ncbi:MAG: phosphoribosylformylglycinamidine synthase subunit PurS [Candidatus Cloacimonetes bacterium]|nr:phosphoribosylformylglycinamidine synthase subunit PurS [Candidatus Cloacimonadota bacterium]